MLVAEPRRVGATELRTVRPATLDYRRWIDLCADAYPVVKLQTVAQRNAAFEEQRDLAQRQPEHRLVGAFRDGVLVGGMRVYDFTMNVRGAQVFTGGVGSVAVGLAYKRRGIARDLIAGFLREYRERGAALAVLYPFRPAFYRKLGFGYGTKLNQYRIALDSLPAGGARDCVHRLERRDSEQFLALYARVQARTNGLIRRETWRAAQRLEAETMYTFGYDDGGSLRGYLTFEFRLGKPGTTNRNELYVHELLYETPAALAGLLAFARSQSDQFSALIINTQDPDLHVLFDDPRNGSDRTLYPPIHHETNAQSLGLMYRVIDAAQLVRAVGDVTFGDLSATVRVDLADAFLPQNAGSNVIAFTGGRPALAVAGSPADVDLAIDVIDFSALIAGSVRLRSLVAYGRAVLAKPEWLARLDAAFAAEPPQCLTRF